MKLVTFKTDNFVEVYCVRVTRSSPATIHLSIIEQRIMPVSYYNPMQETAVLHAAYQAHHLYHRNKSK